MYELQQGGRQLKNIFLSLNLLLLLFLFFVTPGVKATVKALTVNEPISLEICVPNEKTALKLADIIFEEAYPGSINDNLYMSNVSYLEEKDVWSITYRIRNSNTSSDNEFPETCIININRLDAEITFEDIEKPIICIPNRETALKVGEIIIKVLYPDYNYKEKRLTVTYLSKDDNSLECGTWVVEYIPIQPLSINSNYVISLYGGGPGVFFQEKNAKVSSSGIFK